MTSRWFAAAKAEAVGRALREAADEEMDAQGGPTSSVERLAAPGPLPRRAGLSPMGRIELPRATPRGSIAISTVTGGPSDGRDGSPVDTKVGERRYAPAEDYDTLLEAASSMRRTLALAHVHLVGGHPDAALARIQADTGLDLADARAMSMIVGSLTRGPSDGTPA